MAENRLGRDIPEQYREAFGAFEGQFARRHEYKRSSGKVTSVKPGESKILGSIREAIEKSGLRDGMTISFHHHFREGDKVLNMVMEEIAAMGIKNLTLAPSSIANVHAPLIDHIKSGVIT